jgi:hypothetical protein
VRGNIVHLSDVSLAEESHGERFASRDARLGPMIGARQLGCTLTVVPPGKVLIYDGYGKQARNSDKLSLMVHRSADVDYWNGEA